MLGPAARSRLSLVAAVLLTSAAGGSVLAAQVSPAAGSAAFALPVRSVPAQAGLAQAGPAPSLPYGPVVPRRPVAAPLAVPGGLLAPARVPELESVLAAAPRPPDPAPPAPSVVVGPGAPAERVREVQRLLNAAGAGLVVDGAWGPATERAVREAQARAGLPVDGRVGPATAGALRGTD